MSAPAQEPGPEYRVEDDGKTIVLPDNRRCRVCGCTDTNPCVDQFGITCRWTQDDLCSSCDGRFLNGEWSGIGTSGQSILRKYPPVPDTASLVPLTVIAEAVSGEMAGVWATTSLLACLKDADRHYRKGACATATLDLEKAREHADHAGNFQIERQIHGLIVETELLGRQPRNWQQWYRAAKAKLNAEPSAETQEAQG